MSGKHADKREHVWGLIQMAKKLGAEAKWHQKLGILVVVALFLAPTVLTVLQLLTLIGIFYLAMFAMTWDACSGYTGDIILGHAFFIAIGAYTTTALNFHLNISPVITIPAAAVVAAVGGVVIGIPALRLRGPFLSLVTLVAPLILLQIAILFREVLYGERGFPKAPDSLVGPATDAVITIQGSAVNVVANYYIAFFAMVGILAILMIVTRSDTGKIMTATREDPDAVAASGKNPTRYRMFAFVLSGTTAGLAGALFVHSPAGFPQPPEILTVFLSLEVILVAVVGGFGTVFGALVGALLLGIAEFTGNQLTGELPLLNHSVQQLMPLPTMLAGLLILRYAPRGLVPLIIEKGDQLLQRQASGESEERKSPIKATVEKYQRKTSELIEERSGK